MLVHAIMPASRANGPGLRCVVFVQGCNLNCAGCFNPWSHTFHGPDLAICHLNHKMAASDALCFLNGSSDLHCGLHRYLKLTTVSSINRQGGVGRVG
jgi:pyruvate-formate lyase-activating enzyme